MPIYAFVDKIDASPTILFDLDNQSPFSVVEGTQTPPPAKRFSQTSSSSRDGDNIAQSSYSDRVLTIILRVELNATAESQVEGIQALGRLLDDEQWIMWQHDTMIEPVFFRTRRGDMDVDDYMMVDRPKRTIRLTIPAEYAAYGLPVTNTVTINNDPTAATNPMSYAFPDIQGDVKTELSLSAQHDGDPLQQSLYNTAAGPSALLSPLNGGWENNGASASGWTMTASASDATAIGGVTTTMVKASGTSASPFVLMKVLSVPPGEYRVIARVKSSAVGGTLTTGSVTRNLYPTSKYFWYDFGVARPTGTFPRATPAGIGTLTSQPMRFSFTGAFTGNGTISLNRVLLVPAGVDGDALNRMLLTADGLNSGTTYIDSLTQAAWTGPTAFALLTVAGGAGFPQVLPGYPNRLTIIPRMAPSKAYDPLDNFDADDKTLTTVLTYSYYPRYLYTRPATS